ncbi:DUF2089 domain-containing protein [Caldalkalibacillus mannanilyticus]|uniref:DUF2089 domain-containing protein n=1 Tax=Caldalkalibacillus mannanilyticus TaxID=1418 RepID=UPI00046A9888|nr:DUF2089 domain-containing protein [Caldalkalibacillus mannanilyticus]
MSYPVPSSCPVCQSKLVIQELHCDHCDTTLQGRFEASRLSHLNTEQLHFVEIFLKARGNIKEVERELGISYPTVRNRLEQVVEALGYKPEKVSEEKSKRQELLDQLYQGELTPEETLKRLKDIT